MNNTIRKGIIIIFEAIMILTITLLLFLYNFSHIFGAPNYYFINFIYLAIPLTILFFSLRFDGKSKLIKFANSFKTKGNIIITVILILFFIFQAFLFHNLYFENGWDPGTVLEAAQIEASGEYELLDGWYNFYFSSCPNNALLLWIEAKVLQLSMAFLHEESVFILVLIQIFLCCISLHLIYKIAYDEYKSFAYAFWCLIFAIVFVGFSPWYLVIYSDSMSIFIPILLVRLFQLINNSEKRSNTYLFMIGIGILTAIGWKIKPQTCIVSIAILFIFLSGGYKEFEKNIVALIKDIFLILIGFAIFILLFNLYLKPSLHISFDSERELSAIHYMAMGLNDKTDGGHLNDDVQFAWSFENPSARDEAELAVAINRIKEYGFIGLLRHLLRKQMLNYGDGTFGWGEEGNFKTNIPNWSSTTISNILRPYIEKDTNEYQLFLSSKQCIWLFILLMAIFTAFKASKTEVLMMLAVIGITLFELIFEARARYLFCFTPLYLLLGSRGMVNFLTLVTSKSK